VSSAIRALGVYFKEVLRCKSLGTKGFRIVNKGMCGGLFVYYF
jgi:hypothetical protein